MRALLFMALLSSPGLAAANSLELAWLRDGAVQAQHLQHGKSAVSDNRIAQQNVPLGSLWKLFVYAYAVDQGLQLPPYQCLRSARQEQHEDVYCCDPGQEIQRDEALVRSCGPFFDPARLGIKAAAWRAYWAAKLQAHDADWLTDLKQLQPASQVSVQSLLLALRAVPDNARTQAGGALLGVVLNGRGQGSVRHFGSRLQIKTFTWAHPRKTNRKYGGGGGWLADGTPIWFGAVGSSSQVLQRWAPQIGLALPELRQVNNEACVVVNYFARYPLQAVQTPLGKAAVSGPLQGDYQLRFANGQALALRSSGELSLQRQGKQISIVGRHGINAYVARVVEREGDTHQPEAAKALAIAARTYLLQNAAQRGNCWHIDDSTQTQRVGANTPARSTLALVQWSDGLLLQGVAVRYHSDLEQAGVLSWRAAQQQARGGAHFDEILRQAYPNAALGTQAGQSDCPPFAAAETWLQQQTPRWRRRLAGTAGFEPPQSYKVCRIRYGNPHSDQARQRVYVHGLNSLNDRIALAHEYVHLAFARHPLGVNEDFIEQKARYLLGAAHE